MKPNPLQIEKKTDAHYENHDESRHFMQLPVALWIYPKFVIIFTGRVNKKL